MDTTGTVGRRQSTTPYEARYDDGASYLLGVGISDVRNAVGREIALRDDSEVMRMAYPRDAVDAARRAIDADMGRVGRVGRIRTYIGIARNAAAALLAVLLLGWAMETWLPVWIGLVGCCVVAHFTNLTTGGRRHEVTARDRWILGPFGLEGLTDFVCAHAECVVVGRRNLYVGRLEVRRDRRGVASFHPVVGTYPGDALGPIGEGLGPVVLRDRAGEPIVTLERVDAYDREALANLARVGQATP